MGAKILNKNENINMKRPENIDNTPMLNAYPDSIGGTLADTVAFLTRPELRDVFRSFYILPSLFHSDLDRGFSVIDYHLNEELATAEDLQALARAGIDLKLDFILNHASVQSPQFQDLLRQGAASAYRDFFIDWNKFWDGCGTLTADGYIMPDPEYLKPMFFRKPGLPLLTVRFPDGSRQTYWNTFYQEIKKTEAGCGCAGQMDLNIKSPLVWDFYEETLKRLAGYGAKIVRLDAFAYASKEPGAKNFLNEPATWEVLERVRLLAARDGLRLLPEIHAGYREGIHDKIAAQGYLTYDFFLPGLIIDALEYRRGDTLAGWANELMQKGIRTVNMLGCHDGIPLLDLKGLLPDERIEALIETVVARGGYVKNLHGQKDIYYQVNATYYSALGEDARKLLVARALQLFMPGKPQVWYLDLFAGKNDHGAVARAGAGGHKEINRTNLTAAQIEAALYDETVKKQLSMLRFRTLFPAFGFSGVLRVESEGSQMRWQWTRDGYTAELTVDLAMGNLAVGNLAMGNLAVDNLSMGNLAVDNLGRDNLAMGNLAVDNLSMGKLPMGTLRMTGVDATGRLRYELTI